jgi:hypothetical protein
MLSMHSANPSSGNYDKVAVWFGGSGTESTFYPFGVGGAGYRVPEKLAGRIARWTYWRAQLPLILLTLGFVPLVDFWAPSLCPAGRLEIGYFLFSIAILALVAWTAAYLLNRAAYTILLSSCQIAERFPSRAQRKICTKQFGASRRNVIFLPLPVAFLGLLVCATTMYIGAVREDIPMWLLGAAISPLFWYAFVKEGVDEALRRIKAWT